MIEELMPTEREVKTWLVSTLQHVCHIEYFLEELNFKSNDPERPHDLVGPGNKYEWEVIKGLALQFREPKPDFQIYIIPALTLHRQQYHHRNWNSSNHTKPMPEFLEEDMHVGAVDAVCALLENRKYQGGAHDYEEVIEVAKKETLRKRPWMLRMVTEMARLQQPPLERIISLSDFPNIGLKRVVYDSIVNRTNETVEKLRREQGYLLR